MTGPGPMTMPGTVTIEHGLAPAPQADDDGCGCGHDHDHDHADHHHHAPAVTYARAAPKVGRNDACPCGSGKKYKKCCIAA